MATRDADERLLAPNIQSKSPDSADSVRVAVRVRPLGKDEQMQGCEMALEALQGCGSMPAVGSVLQLAATGKRFTFDLAYGPKASPLSLSSSRTP